MTLLLVLAFALALPAMAMARPEFGALGVCARTPIGSADCPPEAAARALDGLEPAWGYYFRPGGGDAFAVVHLLATLKDGIARRLAGDCAADEETANYVSETWAMYVSVDPVDEAMAEDFATVEGFVGNAVSYLAEGGCE